MNCRKVTVRCDAAGQGEVLVDGEPLPVTAITVRCAVQEPTSVTIVMPASEVDLEVEVDEDSLAYTEQEF